MVNTSQTEDVVALNNKFDPIFTGNNNCNYTTFKYLREKFKYVNMSLKGECMTLILDFGFFFFTALARHI